MDTVDVVVVGGGIAGLSVAHDLGADHDVRLFEASPRVGGKLMLAEVGGLMVDVGAEAMLYRRPEGAALALELGLQIVHPTAASPRVFSRGAVRRLPRSLMGVPLDLDELAATEALSPDGVERARHEVLTEVGDDVTVGDLVAARLGDEVVERLVEPLLGGVYAGHARSISAAAAVPQLLHRARVGPLLGAAPPEGGGPVFAGVDGGMGRLPAALVAAGRFDLRTDSTVRALRHVGGDAPLELTVGDTRTPQTVRARRVVLATPAAASARLLAEVAPVASGSLAGIETASVAVVTLVLRAADLPEAAIAGRSGVLVPPIEGREAGLAIKASTFSSSKWDWVDAAAPGLVVLRTSLGRAGEATALQAADDDLVARSRADLRSILGVEAAPVATHVQRWGGGLPQYALGHLDRVGAVRAALAGTGVGVCGAAYDGVGIPAVVGSARRAAAEVRAAQWEA